MMETSSYIFKRESLKTAVSSLFSQKISKKHSTFRIKSDGSFLDYQQILQFIFQIIPVQGIIVDPRRDNQQAVGLTSGGKRGFLCRLGFIHGQKGGEQLSPQKAKMKR